MKAIAIALLLAGVASGAQAQLVGGATGAVGGAVGGVGAGAHAGAGAMVPTPDVTGTVGDATDRATGAVDRTTGAADRAARSTERSAASGKTVRVKAGARVQVARETRCYDGTNYWDPYYEQDGYYYCETSGLGVAAGVKGGH